MYTTQINTVDYGLTDVTIGDGLLQCGGRTIALNKVNTVNGGSVSGNFPIGTVGWIFLAFLLFWISSSLDFLSFLIWVGLLILAISVIRIIHYFSKNPTYRIDLDTSSADIFSIWAVKEDRDKLAELENVIMQSIG